MVDEAIDAIVAAAARGLVLPGDRLIETEIAQKLNISRVPVREALRLLESQGIVVNEPYKGIRLMPLTKSRIEQVLEVRLALELIAVRRIVEQQRNKDADAMKRLDHCIDEMQLMATRKDSYGLALADVAFHRVLCDISGNEFLQTLWEGVARQLTIVIGLSTLDKPMRNIVDEHRALLAAVLAGNLAKIKTVLGEHIHDQNSDVDLNKIISERRKLANQTKEMQRVKFRELTE
jgi:DNA-binding GntR family transcriptional regulator